MPQQAIKANTQMMSEFMNMCSANLRALAESGSAASRSAWNINNEIMDICRSSFTEAANASREALSGGAPDRYGDAMKRAVDLYFERLGRLNGMLFDCCDEIMESFTEHAAYGPMRKAA